ncbi:MAG: hypothetical protein K1X88_27480 [Nannocystaceae bacterium]|nr:hypothetical protein [Nannocystaceae bacterium]
MTRSTLPLLSLAAVAALLLACDPIVGPVGGETAASGDEASGTSTGTTPSSTDTGCVSQDQVAAPGTPGGLCNAGSCEAGIACDAAQSVCVDPAEPCNGFTCGGSARGCCMPDAGLPMCVCNSGFDNTRYPLYCCPQDGSDPICL